MGVGTQFGEIIGKSLFLGRQTDGFMKVSIVSHEDHWMWSFNWEYRSYMYVALSLGRSVGR